MNVKLIKNYSRKTKVYAGIILVCLACVFIRIGLVQRDRGRVIVSFVAEWAKFGKPVTVEKITAEDIPVYTKLTVRGVAGKRASGFVTGDIKDKLAAGQDVYGNEKGEPCGRIVSIGSELDTDTGMFPVEIEFNVALRPGELSVVFVLTHILPSTLVIPNEILDATGDAYYLWKIENDKAKRIQVKIGSRNGYGTTLNEGINPGDLIVFNGRSMLSENDKVRIISEATSRRTDTKGRAL